MGRKTNSPTGTLDLIPPPNEEGSSDTPPHRKGEVAKTIRIAVTGDVHITPLELSIIDTPSFQRLRGIRQLGTVCHVYPTALHTRFDHSLGTLAMAECMLQAIENNPGSENSDQREINPTQRILTRLYALLHDITHVPFGHTIEDELLLVTRHDENPPRILHFIGPGSDIGRLITGKLGKEGLDRLLSIYLWEDNENVRYERFNFEPPDAQWEKVKDWLHKDSLPYDDNFIHDIVSNTVCADLLDYLQRDNYFCNLGVSLEYRFLNFLYLHRPNNGNHLRNRRVFVRLWKNRQRVPRRDTLSDLTRLLETRYLIAERAYFHHTKIISGAMLGRANQESLILGQPGSKSDETVLYDHTDDTLVRDVAVAAKSHGSDIGELVRNRKLYKIIHFFGDADFSGPQSHDHANSMKPRALNILGDPQKRRKWEDLVASQVGAKPGEILVYAPPEKMNNKVAQMNVLWKGVEHKLSDIDDEIIKPRLEQILEAHRKLWNIYLIASPKIRDDEECKELIIEAFKAEFLCPDDDRSKAEISYLAKIIEKELAQSIRAGYKPENMMAHKALVCDAAAELQKLAANDSRSFVNQLDTLLKKRFSGA